MSWWEDLLSSVPLAPVMRERLQLVKDERDRFERERDEALRKNLAITAERDAALAKLKLLTPNVPGRLKPEHEKVLQVLATRHKRQFSEMEISRQTEFSQAKASLYLSELEEMDGVRYVDRRDIYEEWYIRSEGLAYLEKYGLLI